MIPTVDIAALYGPPSTARDAADAAISAAARDIGFLTLTGLPAATPSTAQRQLLLSIFGLSDAKKRALCRRSFVPENQNIYRGWFPLQDGHPTHKEGIDIGPDLVRPMAHDPADPLTEPTPLPAEADLPGWRVAAADTYRALEATGAVLISALARGLDLAETIFDPAFENGISTLRLIRYPVRATAGLDPAFRVGDGYILGAPHADSGFVTLLPQDGVPGLQLEDRTGHWIDVPATEGLLVVNFGKLLERWSGGRIRATVHRVVGSGRERFSVPFFYEPSVDAVIAPIGLGPAFAPVTYGDHLWDATTKFIEQRGIVHLRQPRAAQ